MATAREHLNSVIALCADLQNKTDEELQNVYDSLQEADDAVTDALNEITPW
jgi:hypothetical protein